jgi:hypothetical protein
VGAGHRAGELDEHGDAVGDLEPDVVGLGAADGQVDAVEGTGGRQGDLALVRAVAALDRDGGLAGLGGRDEGAGRVAGDEERAAGGVTVPGGDEGAAAVRGGVAVGELPAGADHDRRVGFDLEEGARREAQAVELVGGDGEGVVAVGEVGLLGVDALEGVHGGLGVVVAGDDVDAVGAALGDVREPEHGGAPAALGPTGQLAVAGGLVAVLFRGEVHDVRAGLAGVEASLGLEDQGAGGVAGGVVVGGLLGGEQARLEAAGDRLLGGEAGEPRAVGDDAEAVLVERERGGEGARADGLGVPAGVDEGLADVELDLRDRGLDRVVVGVLDADRDAEVPAVLGGLGVRGAPPGGLPGAGLGASVLAGGGQRDASEDGKRGQREGSNTHRVSSRLRGR